MGKVAMLRLIFFALFILLSKDLWAREKPYLSMYIGYNADFIDDQILFVDQYGQGSNGAANLGGVTVAVAGGLAFNSYFSLAVEGGLNYSDFDNRPLNDLSVALNSFSLFVDAYYNLVDDCRKCLGAYAGVGFGAIDTFQGSLQYNNADITEQKQNFWQASGFTSAVRARAGLLYIMGSGAQIQLGAQLLNAKAMKVHFSNPSGIAKVDPSDLIFEFGARVFLDDIW